MKKTNWLLPLLLSGCALAHRPPDSDPRHLQIRWRLDYAAATAEAERIGRPVLVCLISGDITERC